VGLDDLVFVGLVLGRGRLDGVAERLEGFDASHVQPTRAQQIIEDVRIVAPLERAATQGSGEGTQTGAVATILGATKQLARLVGRHRVAAVGAGLDLVGLESDVDADAVGHGLGPKV
jgi:hypothetical protein